MLSFLVLWTLNTEEINTGDLAAPRAPAENFAEGGSKLPHFRHIRKKFYVFLIRIVCNIYYRATHVVQSAAMLS